MLNKFRAWYEFCGKHVMDYNPTIGYTNNVYINEAILDEDVVFMQYLGIKDINGTEIYEGDIITNKLYKKEGVAFECYYCEKESMFKQQPFIFIDKSKDLNNKHIAHLSLQMNSVPEKEVIGNIYENPEILNRVNQ